jgi:hypothetical protein
VVEAGRALKLLPGPLPRLRALRPLIIGLEVFGTGPFTDAFIVGDDEVDDLGDVDVSAVANPQDRLGIDETNDPTIHHPVFAIENDIIALHQ